VFGDDISVFTIVSGAPFEDGAHGQDSTTRKPAREACRWMPTSAPVIDDEFEEVKPSRRRTSRKGSGSSPGWALSKAVWVGDENRVPP